jgi:alpha-ketoglutarate-dependent taurine dioxygenase
MTRQSLKPFGFEVIAEETDTPLEMLPTEHVLDWIGEFRLLVLRGYTPTNDDAMLSFCSQLGQILEWEFGAVNELKLRDDAKNYIFTPAAVPFHWDGAFVGKVPRFIFFHCREAPPPDAGGETLFCDTPRLLADVSPDQRVWWDGISITYTTEKVVHYGGSFTSPLVTRHPVTGEPIIRFAEPVDDLNPVRLTIDGIPPDQHDSFLASMRQLLYDPRFCYSHSWRTGDVVIADNHALLHGRRAFRAAAPRHLRRVNIL